MSHDTFLESVPLWDERAICSSVEQLQKLGVNCQLVKNGKARVWGSRTISAPYVIQLPGCRFDVALTRENDQSPFVAVTDFHAGYVSQHLGWDDYTPDPLNPDGTKKTSQEMNDEYQQAQLGRFFQAYSNDATINALQDAGHTIITQDIDQNGELQLEYV